MLFAHHLQCGPLPLFIGGSVFLKNHKIGRKDQENCKNGRKHCFPLINNV